MRQFGDLTRGLPAEEADIARSALLSNIRHQTYVSSFHQLDGSSGNHLYVEEWVSSKVIFHQSFLLNFSSSQLKSKQKLSSENLRKPQVSPQPFFSPSKLPTFLIEKNPFIYD